MDLTEQNEFYDNFNNKILETLDTLFSKKQIRKEEYAEIYSTLARELLSQSNNAPLLAEDLKIKQKELEIKEKENELAEKRIELVDRQIQGFNDKVLIDLFKTSISGWSMMFNSGFLLDENDKPLVPDFMTNDEVTKVYNYLKVNNDKATSNDKQDIDQ